MQFYATATSSSSVSSSQIQAALKAEYDGLIASASGEASFKMTDEQKKVSSETSKRTIVTGGLDDGVRTKLIANGDSKPVKADVQAFLEEGKRSSRYGMSGGLMHISHHFVPHIYIHLLSFQAAPRPPLIVIIFIFPSGVAASRTFRGIWDIMSNRFSEDATGVITTSSDDDATKAALFKKLALTTNYFVDGRYIVTRMMRHNQAKLCQRLGCCCLRP